MVNLLSAAHQLAWAQYPAIWLCEACAILWLVIRAVRSGWVRAGVLLVLCGLMLNGLVTAANAGTMPVVGMPSTVHPVSPMWRAATSKTRLPYLADQARLGLFSIGDLMMLFGGGLIIATCLHRAVINEFATAGARIAYEFQSDENNIVRSLVAPPVSRFTFAAMGRYAFDTICALSRTCGPNLACDATRNA